MITNSSIKEDAIVQGGAVAKYNFAPLYLIMNM